MKTAKQINEQQTGQVEIITSYEQFKERYLPRMKKEDDLIMEFLHESINRDFRNRILNDAKLYYMKSEEAEPCQ